MTSKSFQLMSLVMIVATLVALVFGATGLAITWSTMATCYALFSLALAKGEKPRQRSYYTK